MNQFITERAIRDQAIAVIRARGVDVSNASFNPTTLRQEVPVTAGGILQWDFKTTPEGTPQTVQQLLVDSTVYVVFAWRLSLVRQPDASAGNLAALAGESKEYTWPNPTVFAGAGEADALESVYGRYLNLQIANTNNVVNNLTARMFRVVPTEQQGTISAAVVDTNDVITTYPTAADGYAYDMISRPLPGMLLFSGQDALRAQLAGVQVPAAAVATAPAQNRVALELMAIAATGVKLGSGV